MIAVSKRSLSNVSLLFRNHFDYRKPEFSTKSTRGGGKKVFLVLDVVSLKEAGCIK